MWIKLSKWSTWQNYVDGVLEMEQFPFATPMTDFPVKWTAGAFVLFIDSNPSFAALNLAEDRAQLSINSSNEPSDTSIMCLALACWVIFWSPLKKKKKEIKKKIFCHLLHWLLCIHSSHRCLSWKRGWDNILIMSCVIYLGVCLALWPPK